MKEDRTKKQLIGTVVSIALAGVALWLAGAPLWGIEATVFILIAMNFRVRF